MAGLAKSSKVEYVKIIKDGPSKQAELIFTGLTFIFGTLLIVFAVVPTIKTVFTISAIKEKERITVALKDKLKALTSLDEQYNEQESTFDDLSLVFPTSLNFSLLLSNMDAVVTRNNFILDSIGFSEYKKEGFDIKTASLEPYSVRISVSGKKVYLMNLLKDLEAMPMYPVIESINYGSDLDENGNTNYSLQLMIYHIENVNFYD